MHIPYQETSAPIKTSFADRFWQFVRFTVVTGIIFAASFFALNFAAYNEIFSDFLNPQARAEAETVLSASAGEQRGEPALLSVLTKKQERKSFDFAGTSIVPTDDRLVIPKLGKSVPLVHMGTEQLEGENWSDLEKQIQDGLRRGVVHYPGSAYPGQTGNVFITGHSSYYPWDPGQFKDVFALLGQLSVGDRYYVYYGQKQYTYQIYEKFEVQPSVVSVLEQPQDKKISTLMTCTPVGTTLRRLILRAEEV